MVVCGITCVGMFMVCTVTCVFMGINRYMIVQVTRSAFLSMSVYSVAKSCLSLCESVDCSPSVSSIPRILEWVAVSYSRGSS